MLVFDQSAKFSPGSRKERPDFGFGTLRMAYSSYCTNRSDPGSAGTGAIRDRADDRTMRNERRRTPTGPPRPVQRLRVAIGRVGRGGSPGERPSGRATGTDGRETGRRSRHFGVDGHPDSTVKWTRVHGPRTGPERKPTEGCRKTGGADRKEGAERSWQAADAGMAAVAGRKRPRSPKTGIRLTLDATGAPRGRKPKG